jgi:hypothetical protein
MIYGRFYPAFFIIEKVKIIPINNNYIPLNNKTHYLYSPFLMLLNLQFDPEASKIGNKIIFSCENYELTREDIAELKKDKIVKYVQEETFPEKISCQVLMFLENPRQTQIVFFNPDFILPEKILEDHFLNQDLIQQCQKNGGFRLEFLMPLDKK